MESHGTLSEKIISLLASSANNETPLSEILQATNSPKKSVNPELQRLKRQGVIRKVRDSPPTWSLTDTKPHISNRANSGAYMTRSKSEKGSSDHHSLMGKKKVGTKVSKHKVLDRIWSYVPLSNREKNVTELGNDRYMYMTDDDAESTDMITSTNPSSSSLNAMNRNSEEGLPTMKKGNSFHESAAGLNKDLNRKIVAFLQRQSKPVKTLVLARAVGCKAAKEINPTLYAMMRKNIVVKATESPPTWCVSSSIPQDCMVFSENSSQQSSLDQFQTHPISSNQCSGDGSIPAFQDTVLFNSDLSFDTDYSELTAVAGIPGSDTELFDMGPEPTTSSLLFNNERTDKMVVDEEASAQDKKPSVFRSFFRLNDPVSDDSESENEEESGRDTDKELSDSDDSVSADTGLEAVKEEGSGSGRILNVEESNEFADKDTVCTQINDMEGSNEENCGVSFNTEQESLNRNCMAFDEVLPSELPDNLPIAQDSDSDDESSSDSSTVVARTESLMNVEDFDVTSSSQAQDNPKSVTDFDIPPANLSVKPDNITVAMNVNSFQKERDDNTPFKFALQTDCEKVLKALNIPVAQFALKKKCQLNEERLCECLEELERQNMVSKKGNLWQLTENGNTQFKNLFTQNNSEASVTVGDQMPIRKTQTSGPPPSPMALIQKEKGNKTQSPHAIIKEQQKLNPVKQMVNYDQKQITDSKDNSHISKLNTGLFPATRSQTTIPNAPDVFVSRISGFKSVQDIVTHASTLPSITSKAPVPLMSLNLDRSVQISPAYGISSSETVTNSSSLGIGSNFSSSVASLTNQGIEPSFNQASSSATNQFIQYPGRSSSQPGSFRGPSYQTQTDVTKSLFTPTTTSVVASNQSVFRGSQPSKQSSASSCKPPLTPADILAKSMKKTEISPAKIRDSAPVPLMSAPVSLMSAPVSLMSNSPSLQTNAPQKVVSSSQISGGSLGLAHSSFMSSSQTGLKLTNPQVQPSLNPTGSNFFKLPQPPTLLQGQPSIKPLITPVQNPTAIKAIPQAGQSLSLSTESFAALNKNPVSALMEYAQSRKMEARIELIGRRGSAHRPTFEMAAFVGSRQFPSASSSNKKDAKQEACDIALRQLIAEGQFHQASQAAAPITAPGLMTHFDKMAALTHRGFTALVSQIRSESFAGRKVIAGLVMKRSEADTGILISLGTGNRCITGQQLSLEGNTINDSHAEIITRRGFLRFLYRQLLDYDPNKPNPLFEKSPRGRIQIKSNISFHLYISTAPCGDGALFSPRDAAANNAPVDKTVRPPHNPTFTSNVQGLLRTKVEGGEGTIPIEPGFKGQTFDGIQRGERLLTMSCTDKVCRWNVVGLQGALLSHFLEPVYLDSLTLGLLYDHGHLARAVCCRVGKGETDIDTLLPQGYRLNHPWLGRVTVCDPPREVQKTKALSVNWCFGDTAPEVVDGTLGLNLTSIEKEMFSRCSKRHLYNSYKKLCEKFGRLDLQQAQTYREAKDLAKDFIAAKQAMLKKFKENKYGKWVSKPVEEEMFT